jgi:hypothetical protein
MTTPALARPERDWLEIVATIVLAVAAVATAWSSYQATRWNGEQTKASSRNNAVRIQAARASALWENQAGIDVATFIQWVDANARGDDELATFYEERFRPEFGTAFDAWLATDPLTNPEAPLTPFAMEEYEPAARTEADRLDETSEGLSAVVQRNIQRSANYVLGVVLFAVALFFAGMSTKLQGRGSRLTLLIVGCLIFLGTAGWIATFPVIFSV